MEKLINDIKNNNLSVDALIQVLENCNTPKEKKKEEELLEYFKNMVEDKSKKKKVEERNKINPFLIENTEINVSEIIHESNNNEDISQNDIILLKNYGEVMPEYEEYLTKYNKLSKSEKKTTNYRINLNSEENNDSLVESELEKIKLLNDKINQKKKNHQ